MFWTYSPLIGIVLSASILLVAESYTVTRFNQGDASWSDNAKYDPEIWMNATELITSKGFPAENYWVTTKDGYILNVLRIPHGRNKKTIIKGPKPVVVLQHGFTASCACFLTNLANESLAYILADYGADVWLPNSRGNRFSTNHTTLDPNKQAFWNFTWDEMAKYDLPATIDFILQKTRESQIYYVGHSQGTTIAFASFSENKTLASHIKHFIAMAPVARLQYTKSPITYLAPFARYAVWVLELFGNGCYGRASPTSRHLEAELCSLCEECATFCLDSIFVFGGFDFHNINLTRVPVYVAQGDAGTSVKDVLHWAQGVNSKKFQHFDYGSAALNNLHYGQPTPPIYHPENVTVPVAVFYGTNDWLADPRDVKWLLSQLPHVTHNMSYQGYCHTDFTTAWNAPRYVYNHIVDIIFKKY